MNLETMYELIKMVDSVVNGEDVKIVDYVFSEQNSVTVRLSDDTYYEFFLDNAR